MNVARNKSMLLESPMAVRAGANWFVNTTRWASSCPCVRPEKLPLLIYASTAEAAIFRIMRSVKGVILMVPPTSACVAIE